MDFVKERLSCRNGNFIEILDKILVFKKDRREKISGLEILKNQINENSKKIF